MLDLLLVDLGRPPGLLLLGWQGHGFDSTKVLRDGLRHSPDVGQGVLLEEQLERDDLVELDAGDATDEALPHGLVAADIQVVDVVELGVGGRLERLGKVEDLWLVVVDDHHELAALVEPFDPDIMELKIEPESLSPCFHNFFLESYLSSQKVLICKHHFLSLETKVEHKSQVARVGDHEREELLADVGVGAQQEALGIGGGEADVDLLGDGGLVVALEVVLDHVVCPHVDADLVGADRPLERGPAAVAVKVIVSFSAFSAIHTGVG